MNENITAEDTLLDRMQSAMQQAQLTARPVFALAAQPSPAARLPTLFTGKDTAPVKFIDEPPSLRRAGFDLEAGDSRIVRGRLRQALVQGWKVLELWPEGTLIYAVDASVEPCWGNSTSNGPLRVNPLALTEPVYLFAELSRLVYMRSPG